MDAPTNWTPGTPYADPGSAPTADETLVAAYLEHREPLRRWLGSRIRDDDLAEELTQESFIRLMGVLRAGEPVANPRAWLFTVAGNLLVSHVRHARVSERATVRRDLVSEPVSAEAIVLHRERLDDLGRAIVRLADEDRSLLLQAGHGEPGPRMAERAGISAEALRTRLCRARRRLRTELGLDDRLPGLA